MRKKTAFGEKAPIENQKPMEQDLERFVAAERPAVPASILRFELPSIRKAMSKFDRTGTADVVVGKHYGVGIKDEGDYISVRFGSRELTEIGSVPTAEQNFSTKDKAFAFAEQIQNHVREILGQRGLKIHWN